VLPPFGEGKKWKQCENNHHRLLTQVQKAPIRGFKHHAGLVFPAARPQPRMDKASGIGYPVQDTQSMAAAPGRQVFPAGSNKMSRHFNEEDTLRLGMVSAHEKQTTG